MDTDTPASQPPVSKKKKQKPPKESPGTVREEQGKRKKDRTETDSEPVRSQPSTSRSRDPKRKSPPKKQRQARRSASNNASVDFASRKKQKQSTLPKKKKKAKKPKVASVVIAPAEESELVDISAEETTAEIPVETTIPTEEQEVTRRAPSPQSLSGDKPDTGVPTQVGERPGPSRTSQESRSRSLERGEHSSRNSSTGSVTSRSGWTYGWGWSERQPPHRELQMHRSARKTGRRPVHERLGDLAHSSAPSTIAAAATYTAFTRAEERVTDDEMVRENRRWDGQPLTKKQSRRQYDRVMDQQDSTSLNNPRMSGP